MDIQALESWAGREDVARVLSPGQLNGALRFDPSRPDFDSVLPIFDGTVASLLSSLNQNQTDWLRDLADALNGFDAAPAAARTAHESILRDVASAHARLREAQGLAADDSSPSPNPKPAPTAPDRTGRCTAVLVKPKTVADLPPDYHGFFPGPPMGFLATLAVEWFPAPDADTLTLTPHADWAITPRDGEFDGALEHALAWARTKFPDTHGRLVWNLSLRAPGEWLPYIGGPSLGVALGVATATALDPTRLEELGITVTGAMHANGTLNQVFDYTLKVDAARARDSGCYGFACDNVGAFPNCPEGFVTRHGQIDGILGLFADAPREMEAMRARTLGLHADLALLMPPARGAATSAIGALFVPLGVEREIRQVERISATPEGDKPDSGATVPHNPETNPESVAAFRRFALTYDPPRPLLDAIETTDARRVSPRPSVVVLLAAPGAGKSTLLQWLAHARAANNADAAPRRLPILVRLGELATYLQSDMPDGFRPDGDAFAALHGFVGKPARLPGLSLERLRSWLRNDRVLLLLDGLDEIGGNAHALKLVGSLLQASRACQVLVTCRERNRALLTTVGLPEYGGETDRPVYRVAGVAADQQAAFVRNYLRFLSPGDDTVDARAASFAASLTSNPLSAGLIANPMMLSLLCYFHHEHPGDELPTTRGELYTAVLDHYLQTIAPKLSPGIREAATHLNGARRRVMVEALAMRLAWERDGTDVDTAAQSGVGYRSARETFHRALSAARDDAPDFRAGTFAEESRIRLRLLSVSGPREPNADFDRDGDDLRFSFLHLTFQEYFAGCAIAEAVRKRGFKPYRKMLENLSLLPHWSETLIFFTGRLKQLGAYDEMLDFLEMLDNEKTDGFLHQRLVLACECAVEANEESLWTEWEQAELEPTAGDETP